MHSIKPSLPHGLSPFVKHQRGATLIVALVILAVITLLGLASMRSSNQQLLMAASARDRAIAFQAAESALIKVERWVMEQSFRMNSFTPTCTGDRCFDQECTSGLCFSGDFDGTSKSHCRLALDDTGAQQRWRENIADSPVQVEIVDTQNVSRGIPYLVEFMCFVPRGEQVITSSTTESESDVPLYRITVMAQGEAGRSRVVLQSILRGSE